ncbi:MAG: TadE/TadG family type IV pilus assembly protein [Thermoguttaceae bacterium]
MKAQARRRAVSGLWGGDRRGAATVEFAVTAPLLVALLLGMIDVGQLANVGQAVSGASAYAAREAARPSTDSVAAVQSRVVTYLSDRFPNLTSAQLASALSVRVLDSAGATLTDASLSAIPVRSRVTVDVVFQFDAVRWLDGVGVGQGRTLHTSTAVRRE